MRKRTGALFACGVLLAVACAEADGPLALTGTAPAPHNAAKPTSAKQGGAKLSVYAGGVDRATPQRPCLNRPENRQFDFWVGEWDVMNAAGVGGSTNVISSLLDGCVIHESWTAANGGRGRSINTFDRDTDMWHQTWVAASVGHLRMAGGLQGDIMRMEGVRTQPNGVQWFDTYTWTPVNPDRVIQAGRLQIPAGNVDVSFALTYDRVPAVDPAPEAPTTFCQPGGNSEASRQLDFWLGSWRVLRANGRPLGFAEVGSDLSGCLTEESFRTAKGYESISFAYYDVIEQRWYRTLIDSEGERVELRGEVGEGPRSMTGDEDGPGPHSTWVRVTLQPVSADVVHQVWETSRNDGESWTEALRLIYERQ